METVVEQSNHRIATSVSTVFQECLGKFQPANPVEWSTAYLNFPGKKDGGVLRMDFGTIEAIENTEDRILKTEFRRQMSKRFSRQAAHRFPQTPKF